MDKETYYRKGVYEHFTQDCKCSTSITARIDVSEFQISTILILVEMENPERKD
ncbi:MAG: hypothetical protein SPK26_13585 [Treponema sp.]|nr:hypothetical protein [Treponema sp.]